MHKTQIVKDPEHEAGRKAEDICRELSITTASFYKWRALWGYGKPAMLRS
ncbi:MAG: transposase [Flammeovirgaceae bacterium]|nr:transposase [Flammeovirgaceae bacterium]